MTTADDPELRGARLVRAVVIWLAEIGIGMVPLIADVVMHAYTKPVRTLMGCTDPAAPDSKTCTLITDGSDAEKCILVVVLSSLAVLESVDAWVRPAGQIRLLVRLVVMFCLGAAMFLAALLYARNRRVKTRHHGNHSHCADRRGPDRGRVGCAHRQRDPGASPVGR